MSATERASNTFLSNEELERLAKHKYSASGVSVLDPAIQPFWKWVVELLPVWLAPNALTLAGLVINGLATAVLMLYSSDCKQHAPKWCYFLCAFALFLYQTLDAIDGKQARRTNSSSPLGELFDHGCDALTTVFVTAGTCMTVHLGTLPALHFVMFLSTLLVFYTAHWQSYCSGTLRFGSFDATEAEFGVIFIYLLTGFFGPAVWDTEILSTGFEIKLIPAVFFLASGLFKLLDYFNLMRKINRKDGSAAVRTNIMSPSFPMAIFIISTICVWLKSGPYILGNHLVLFTMTFGLASVKLCHRLLMANMSQSEIIVMDSCLVGPLLMLLNQYLRLADDYVALWLCFVFCAVDLLRYDIGICKDICSHLNIRCFSIQPTSSKAL